MLNVLSNIFNNIKQRIFTEELESSSNVEQIDAFNEDRIAEIVNQRTEEIKRAFEYLENRRNYDAKTAELQQKINDLHEEIKPLRAEIDKINAEIRTGKNYLLEEMQTASIAEIEVDGYFYRLKEETETKRTMNKDSVIALLGKDFCLRHKILKQQETFNKDKVLEHCSGEMLKEISEEFVQSIKYIDEEKLAEANGE